MSDELLNSKQARSDSRLSLKWLAGAIFIFFWLAILMGGYFWAHKPFDFAIAGALAYTIWQIAAWLLIVALGAGLGQAVAGRWLAAENGWARLALSAGIGLGLLSGVLAVIGLLGWLRPWLLWLLVVVLAVVLVRPLRQLWTEVHTLTLPRPASRFEWGIVIYGAASLLLTFLRALAPPTAWDSLTYHLTGPRFFLEAGRFIHPVDIPHFGFPLLGQMQFTLGIALAGDAVPALLHFGYGLLTLALVAALTWQAFGRGAAWLAAAVWLSVPTLFTLMSWPYVDVTLMFYTTAAFYAFFRWRGTKAQGWLVVLGLVVGFSGGVKYTAVAAPVALSLSIAWESRRDGLLTTVRRLALIGSVALLLVVPWLLENWLTTGNPVYPFFFNDGLFWDSWRAWWYDRPGTGLLATAPWRLLLVPLEATIAGTEGTVFYEATIGPFILGALFLLPLAWRYTGREERPLIWHLLLFFGVNYLLWLNGVARTALLLRARFLFMAFGVAAVLGGLALDRVQQWKRPQLALDWLVQTFIIITLALLLFTSFVEFLRLNPLPVVVGLQSEDDYLLARLQAFRAAEVTINQLPPGSEVELLWETRSYRCQVVCHPDPILDKFLHLTQHFGYDAADIAALWQQEGISHVLLYQAGLAHQMETSIDPFTDADLAVLDDLKANYLAEIGNWGGDAYILYELTP